MILKNWAVFIFQVWSEAKRVDWFPKNDLFGAVMRVVLIIGLVSIVFLGLDWLILRFVSLILKL